MPSDLELMQKNTSKRDLGASQRGNGDWPRDPNGVVFEVYQFRFKKAPASAVGARRFFQLVRGD